jgi:MarR family transcriptional regulator, 2-MHQ and catechol-resistance regulon repressor
MSPSPSSVIVLPVLRELVRCFQAFEQYSMVHVRTLGLTLPQFDIVATLGNTTGMTFKCLGEKTLITKGTLTGIIDRLAAMGVVERVDVPGDRRSTLVRLTAQGERLFTAVFEPHLAYLANAFGTLPEAERAALAGLLLRLRESLTGSLDATSAAAMTPSIVAKG